MIESKVIDPLMGEISPPTLITVAMITPKIPWGEELALANLIENGFATNLVVLSPLYEHSSATMMKAIAACKGSLNTVFVIPKFTAYSSFDHYFTFLSHVVASAAFVHKSRREWLFSVFEILLREGANPQMDLPGLSDHNTNVGLGLLRSECSDPLYGQCQSLPWFKKLASFPPPQPWMVLKNWEYLRPTLCDHCIEWVTQAGWLSFKKASSVLRSLPKEDKWGRRGALDAWYDALERRYREIENSEVGQLPLELMHLVLDFADELILRPLDLRLLAQWHIE